MHHAIDNCLLHPEQYGGVLGRDSITPAYIEELQWEVTRATRQPIVKTDFDATSCYDRIIPSLASLVCRAFGQHHLLCNLHAENLRQANYLLKTTLGVTESGYSHSRQHPIYGTGQGSPSSPSIWCFLSCRLFEAHDQRAYGATFQSPNQEVSLSMGMLGFVDDTYSCVNDPENKLGLTALLARAQADAQLWSDLLGATGGALEAPKCKFHAVSFTFSKSGAPVMQEPSQDCHISVRDNITDVADYFESLPPRTAHQILGCHKDPCGQQKTAFLTIQKNAIDRSKLIAGSGSISDDFNPNIQLYQPWTALAMPTDPCYLE